MGQGWNPLFKATIASGVTQYVGLPVTGGRLGGQVAWTDAISAATCTVEFTDFNQSDAATDAVTTSTPGSYQWKDSGLTFTGPAASAAGSFLINVSDVTQRRARLKIVTTAICNFEIYSGQ